MVSKKTRHFECYQSLGIPFSYIDLDFLRDSRTQTNLISNIVQCRLVLKIFSDVFDNKNGWLISFSPPVF